MPKTVKKSASTSSKNSGLGGLKDLVTQSDPLAQIILKKMLKLSHTYGFQRVETPLLEEVALFQAYYGRENIPALELEASGKTLAVRPTLLPSLFRSYIQHKVAEEKPLSKWLYFGNVIHQEEKTVSDYEFGLEVLGTFSHLTEAQALGAAWHFMQDLGLAEATFEITTIGDADSQSAYSEVLLDYLKPKKYELCDNCTEALSGRVLDVFRCDNLECQVVIADAPTILDYLDNAAQKHFTSLLEALDELQIPYQLNPLYAGPVGSSRTNAVIKFKRGNQVVVLGEAAYHDALMKQVMGRNVSCFGFQGNLSSLVHAMQLADVKLLPDMSSEVFLVPLGELASKRSLRLFHDLTIADVHVYDHFGTAGVKNQLKQAEELQSRIALIMGQKEAAEEKVILRDVKSGMQEIFSYDKIVVEVKKRLGK